MNKIILNREPSLPPNGSNLHRGEWVSDAFVFRGVEISVAGGQPGRCSLLPSNSTKKDKSSIGITAYATTYQSDCKQNSWPMK